MKFLKKPKDFLYRRKGPWPQPSPEHPFGEAPGVIHLPLRETIDWWLHIGSRYLFTLSYTPIAYFRGLLRPGLSRVSDQEFLNHFTHSMMAKFIKNDFDDKDIKVFGQEVSRGGFKIVDLEPVKVVKTFRGIYSTASKVLLKETDDGLKVENIYLDKTEVVFTPGDGEKWELAKYFVLQGAALCATLVVHPLLHFPLDSINAITKTALPKNNILFQLLFPHTRFTLYLEKAVLTFNSSLLHSKWWMPYAPYPGPYEGIRQLLVEGYLGIDHNDSYPSYVFPLSAPDIYGDYGDFHKEYYEVFKRFVDIVLSEIREEEFFYIDHWIDYIHSWLPGFPKSCDRKKDPYILNRIVTSYLFDVTVGHTVDHYNYGHMDLRKVPLRIRHEVPTKNSVIKLDRKKLTKFWDFGKYEMARRLFFNSSTKTRLIDTNYQFVGRSDVLKNAVIQFKEDLKKAEIKLIKESKNYIPLKEIAASIQF